MYVHLFGGGNEHSFSATQWTFHIDYVTKRTWRYVFRILQKSSHRYVFFMKSGSKLLYNCFVFNHLSSNFSIMASLKKTTIM